MNRIDEIMDMLNWNNSDEMQSTGIALAKQVKCLSIFMQPVGKNLWDNCARILYTKSDDELRPYLSKLLEWIQDLNWPGAMAILERLQQFERDEVFIAVVGEFKRCAQAIGDELWWNTLTELSSISFVARRLSLFNSMIYLPS